MVTYNCTKCVENFSVDERLSYMKRIRPTCPKCGTILVKAKKRARRKTDAQKRSIDQEHRAMKAYQVRRQPASGASEHYKSDGRERNKRRVEVKETTAKSYSLKLETLLKLEKEATCGEMPIFQIEFQGIYPYKRYEVLTAGTLENLIAENEKLRSQIEDSNN